MPGAMTKDVRVRPSSTALWCGILAGPMAWIVDLQLRYALVSWACRRGAAWVLIAISLPLVLVCGVGALFAWRGWNAGDDETAVPGRIRFMAVSGLFLCAVFALTIIAATIPDFFLRPCD